MPKSPDPRGLRSTSNVALRFYTQDSEVLCSSAMRDAAQAEARVHPDACIRVQSRVMKFPRWDLSIVCAATMFVALVAQAQPSANAGNTSLQVNTGTTPKPIPWPSPALPDGPIPLETGV